jgi:DNA-binding MarR family transcriptional regulator
MPTRFFEIVLRIKRTCVAAETRIRREAGLTDPEFGGLLAVAPGESLTGAAFAARMDLSPSRGSRVLAALVRRGLLRSRPQAGDRRSVTIALTPEGEALRRSLERRMEACGHGLLEGLTPAERERVERSFRLFEKVFPAHP